MKRVSVICMLVLLVAGCRTSASHADKIAVQAVVCGANDVARIFATITNDLPAQQSLTEVKQKYLVVRLRNNNSARPFGTLECNFGGSRTIIVSGLPFDRPDTFVIPLGDSIVPDKPNITTNWKRLNWK